MKDSSRKPRAPRNKTLVITDEDRRVLGPLLLRQKDLTACSPVGFLNRTLCADLLDVLPLLPGQFADLIILDPPYNLDKDFHGNKFRSSGHEQYYKYLASWFPEVVRCLKPGGSLYLCGDWRSTAALHRIVDEHLTVLNRITWQREKGRGASRNWKNAMEDIWFGVKNRQDYYFDVEAVKMKRRVMAPYRENGRPKDWEETEEGNFRLTHPSNFWDDISIPYWSMPENTDHPTQKPEKLIAKLILASCPSGGVVFDPFSGSGTTLVVAKKLGRKYFGVEVNEEYAVWTEKRLALADQDKTIQGYTGGVFWERNTSSDQMAVNRRKK